VFDKADGVGASGLFVSIGKVAGGGATVAATLRGSAGGYEELT
jgi:hypothetical protein